MSEDEKELIEDVRSEGEEGRIEGLILDVIDQLEDILDEGLIEQDEYLESICQEFLMLLHDRGLENQLTINDSTSVSRL